MNNRLLFLTHSLGLVVLYLNILPLRFLEWRDFVFPPAAQLGLPEYDDFEAEEKIKAAVGDTIIDSRFTPVMIFRDDQFASLGTLVRSDPENQIVIAPAHNFDEGFEYYYSYQVLIPMSETRHPIGKVLLPPNRHSDYVICIAGESRLIGQLINFNELGYDDPSYLERESDLRFTSLFDGREFISDCILYNKASYGERSNRAIPIESIVGPGECGMPFIGAQGGLYHLVQSLTLAPNAVRFVREDGIRVPYTADYWVGLEKIDLKKSLIMDKEGFYAPRPELVEAQPLLAE